MKSRIALIVFAFMLAGGNAYATTYGLTCTNTGSDHLATALAGTSGWTSPPATMAAPKSGDIVQLTGFCQGDVIVKTSGIEFDNHTSAQPYNGSDGINGELIVVGANNITIKGLNLEGGQGTDSLAYPAHTSTVLLSTAAVTFIDDFIGPSPLIGLDVASASNATLVDATVQGNGTANIAGVNDGIRVEATATAALSVTNVFSNTGNGVTVMVGSSAEFAVSDIRDNGNCTTQCGSQIYVSGASIVRMQDTTVHSPAATLTSEPPLIVAVGGSSLFIENSSSLSDAGSAPAAVLAASASSVVLNSSTVQTTGLVKPVIEASGSSSVVLAGGNTVTASGTNGMAIQIDHSSSLQHQQAVTLQYAADAPEAISGAGAVQIQSSMDLGQGTASALTWTLSGSEIVNVQQNSSFRLSGGVSITGGNGVKIQQGSNGFFNVNNTGTNTAVITCTNSANNPMGHVANPSSVSPAVTSYNLNDVLNGVAGAGHPSQTNACLNF